MNVVDDPFLVTNLEIAVVLIVGQVQAVDLNIWISETLLVRGLNSALNTARRELLIGHYDRLTPDSVTKASMQKSNLFPTLKNKVRSRSAKLEGKDSRLHCHRMRSNMATHM